jgi:hypothetical protein
MKNVITLTILAASMTLLPCLAQNEIQNNQPLSRWLSADEARIEGKLQLDYKTGLIDATQLAAMQRDFDGILVQEDAWKSRGLLGLGRARTAKALAEFERRVDESAGVCTTQAAQHKHGPTADENNVGLAHIEPTH